MSRSVGNHQVGTFTTPVRGGPRDPDVLRNHDNELGDAANAHDADASVHNESGPLASRPAAGTEGRVYYALDGGVVQAWYDDGADWIEASSPLVHTHTQGEVVGLVADLAAKADDAATTAALAGKAASSHTHAQSDVTGLVAALATKVDTAGLTGGKVPRATDADTLGDSAISDDGTVTSNATQPRARFTAATSGTISGSGSVELDFSTTDYSVGTWTSGSNVRVPATGLYLVAVSGWLTGGAGVYAARIQTDSSGVGPSARIEDKGLFTCVTVLHLTTGIDLSLKVENLSGGGGGTIVNGHLDIAKLW